MAARLDQFLQPGEPVLYREPSTQGGWLGNVVHGFALGLVGPLTNATRGVVTTVLSVLLLVVAHRAAASPQGVGMAEAAVTGRRVLFIKGEGKSLEFADITVDEVAAIEVLARAVRVTRRDGRIAVLDGLESAPDLGLALARAAGAPPPWVPGRKERLAQEAAILAAWTGGALAYALALDALGGEPLAWASLLPQVITLLLAGGVGVLGWAVGLLVGLAVLRSHLTRAEMRAWMRQSPIFAPKPQPGARTGPFAKFCLWFVDQLYDQVADPPGSPGERRGR